MDVLQLRAPHVSARSAAAVSSDSLVVTGSYLAQFLWMPITYGSYSMPQCYLITPSKDYLTAYTDWLNNLQDRPPTPLSPTGAEPLPSQYIATGRDLASCAHTDFTYQAYLNAALDRSTL
jgi:hypothetical protein